MRIALAELRRQPGRFLPVGVALALLVVLLVVLGGFLDGLELSQTGAIRAQEPGLIVVDADAGLQLSRSRVDATTVQALAAVPGVVATGPLDQYATTASPAGGTGLEDVVLYGYGVATDVLPAPPAEGQAVVDAALADLIDLNVGDVLEIGPDSAPVTVSALVDDLTQGAPTIWVRTDVWSGIVAAASPADLPPTGTVQALVVQGDGSQSAAELASTIAEAVAGVDVVTPTQAVDALPVVQQQSSTFAGIIGVTFAVTLLVVALFFALITLERLALYAVLKALGARSRDLLTGLSVQAVVISVVALVVGIGLSLAFVAVLPASLPIRLVPARLGFIAAGTVATAVLGGLLTLRRILAIDPADAIG